MSFDFTSVSIPANASAHHVKLIGSVTIDILLAKFGSKIQPRGAKDVDTSSLPIFILSKNFLMHLFDMKLVKDNTVGGYEMHGNHHVDFDALSECSKIPGRGAGYATRTGNTPKVCDGYVRVDEKQFSVYKSYFNNMTQTEVVKKIIEALTNILWYEQNEKVYELVGKSSDDIKIKIVVDLKSKRLITAFPLLDGSEDVKENII